MPSTVHDNRPAFTRWCCIAAAADPTATGYVLFISLTSTSVRM
jgi:hypothetical protein